jgi:uncharacterized protein YukE
MAVDGKLQMDHDAMAAVAKEVNSLAVAVQSVQSYIADNDLKQEHFGGHNTAAGAFQSFDAAVKSLSQSVGKAYNFLVEAETKLEQSSKMTEATDVNNAWGLDKSGKDL